LITGQLPQAFSQATKLIIAKANKVVLNNLFIFLFNLLFNQRFYIVSA